MSDVNGFIDAIGQDVSTAVTPRVEELIEGFGKQVAADYIPKISAFAHQLVKEIIDEQSVVVRDFSGTLIKDLFQRYRPELAGELHTTIVPGGIQLRGQGVRLDVTRRDTGAVVSSLDIPVSLTIRVDPLALTIQDTTIALDVIR